MLLVFGKTSGLRYFNDCSLLRYTYFGRIWTGLWVSVPSRKTTGEGEEGRLWVLGWSKRPRGSRVSGVVGFQDRTEGQVKKHSGPICWIKQRREREWSKEKKWQRREGRERKFVLLESPFVRMSGFWSAVLNGLFFLLEFVKEWRGGLMCIISYHKIDFCVTNPQWISAAFRFDHYIKHVVVYY